MDKEKKAFSLVDYARKNLVLFDDETPRQECSVCCPSCKGIVIFTDDEFVCGYQDKRSGCYNEVPPCDVIGKTVKEFDYFVSRGRRMKIYTTVVYENELCE